MKQLAVTITFTMVMASVVGSLSSAKVTDFNALINDNISAQKQLHGEIQKQVDTTNTAFRGEEKRKASSMVVESDTTQINAPTSSKVLRYKKEKRTLTVSRKKQLDRVSQEFDDANSSF